MNINELRAKMNDFLDQLENKEMEEKKVHNVKSFQDATKEEIKEYLNLYNKGLLNISDYWKVGDKRIELNGATYVIADYTNDKIVIMRTDLVGLSSKMNISGHSEYLNSYVDQYLNKLCSSILGVTFSDLAMFRCISDHSHSGSRLLWIPSASEVFGEGVGGVEKDGEQFEYFKKIENRQLGCYWWTRNGFVNHYDDAIFVDSCIDVLKITHIASMCVAWLRASIFRIFCKGGK